MIKNLTLLFFLTFISSSILAQKTPFGLKGGMNISSIGGDFEDVSTKINMHAGFHSSLPLSKKLSLKPELMLSNQGARSYKNSELKFSYWYLNMPLLLRYQEETPFFLDFGIQAGVILSALRINNSETRNITSGIENFDFSISIGIGHYITQYISIAARYNHGLTNTSRNPDSNENSFPNRVFQVSLSYDLFK